MSIFLLAQIVGILAVVISILVFQVNKRPVMLKLGISAAVLYTLHFFLLGAFTGAAMSFIGASRFYIFSKVRPNRQNDWILFSFIIFAVLDHHAKKLVFQPGEGAVFMSKQAG